MVTLVYLALLSLGQQTITPLPKVFFQNSTSYAIGNLSFSCSTQDKHDCMELVQPMCTFYENLMFPSGKPVIKPKSNLTVIKKLMIYIETKELPIDFKHNNETHQIVVNNSGIIINAHNSFGVARALASVSQLIHSDYTNNYLIEQTYVQDEPAYPYRSVMVDSSRHFLPISTLKRQVNAISIAKMSILHLHEPDSQSFPTLVDSEPAKNFVKGAWETNGVKYYHTLEDLYELASYAKDLGVFILLEFDMPGHASSWYSADPGIVCSCRDVINPSNPLTFDYIRSFIRDIYRTIYQPFGFNPMIHLGGDEVNQGCFSNDPNVSAFMQVNGFSNRDAWRYLHQKVVDIIIEETKSLYPDRNLTEFTRIYWQESFGNGNNHSVGGIVHAWLSTHPISQAAQGKIHVVRSQGWYLDVNQAGGNREAFIDGWMDFYAVDPAQGLQDDNKKYALGGGPCQWGEKVHNWNIDNQIWPRSIAAAEVLWSNPSNRTITPELTKRLNKLTCKLRQAGVASGTLTASEPCPGIDDRGDGKIIPNWDKQPAQDNKNKNNNQKNENEKETKKDTNLPVVNPFDMDSDEMGWAGRKK